MRPISFHHDRRGHTLMEMAVATVASGMLLVGLGSVMIVARQIAFTPSAPTQRIDAADEIGKLADDLRFATLLLQQSATVVDFVVADRDGDGAAERIRYEWSGTPGAPLTRSINGGSATTVLDEVQEFLVTPVIQTETKTLKTITTTAEVQLAGNTNATGGIARDVNSSNHSAQQINPATFTTAAPASATGWNATRVDVFAQRFGATTGTLSVQLRPAGSPNNGPTSHPWGRVDLAEASLASPYGWNVATFSTPVTGLKLHRRYVIACSGVMTGGANDAQMYVNDSGASGVLESNDGGGSWNPMSSRQIFYRLYGTYTAPGPTYNVERRFVPYLRVALRSGDQPHSRVDASIPLVNNPEQVSAYWRTDFNADPTAADSNRDGVIDWVQAGGGSFNTGHLAGGVWNVGAEIQSRPLCDFTTNTTVEVSCRNSTPGGNGAVVRINVDRQGGLHGPLFFYLQRQTDGTQTLTLYGKSSDAENVALFTRQRLSADFVRVRLTIVPANNVVGLEINGEDQGAFVYPTYAPSSANGFLSLSENTSDAHFDYAEVRVSAN